MAKSVRAPPLAFSSSSPNCTHSAYCFFYSRISDFAPRAPCSSRPYISCNKQPAGVLTLRTSKTPVEAAPEQSGLICLNGIRGSRWLVPHGSVSGVLLRVACCVLRVGCCVMLSVVCCCVVLLLLSPPRRPSEQALKSVGERNTHGWFRCGDLRETARASAREATPRGVA
jgi:hypothetical protein